MKKYAGLQDLITERWLRNRNNGDIVWKTKDGKEIPLKDMTDEHLDNAVNRLMIADDIFERLGDASPYL